MIIASVESYPELFNCGEAKSHCFHVCINDPGRVHSCVGKVIQVYNVLSNNELDQSFGRMVPVIQLQSTYLRQANP